MTELNYRVLSYISIMFFIMNFILSLSCTGYLGGLAFMLIAVCILLLDKFKEKMAAFKIMLVALMFLPVVTAVNVQTKVAYAATAIIALAFMKKKQDQVSKDRKLTIMQSIVLALFLMIFLGSMITGNMFADRYMSPYAVLYLIFTILNFRQMRDIEFNIKRKKTLRYDISFAALLGVFTAILSVSVVRNLFLSVAGGLFMLLGIGLYNIINKVYLFVFWILSKFSTTAEAESNPRRIQMFKEKTVRNSMNVPLKTYIIIGIAIFAVVLCIILFKFFKLQYKKEIRTSEFDEKKEYISVNYTNTNNGIYSRFKKGSFKERIRYFYYKLLKECRKQNIPISKYDTTYEIKKKAQSSFKSEDLNYIRNIYLKARYTDLDCSKEDYEELIKAYKHK